MLVSCSTQLGQRSTNAPRSRFVPATVRAAAPIRRQARQVRTPGQCLMFCDTAQLPHVCMISSACTTVVLVMVLVMVYIRVWCLACWLFRCGQVLCCCLCHAHVSMHTYGECQQQGLATRSVRSQQHWQALSNSPTCSVTTCACILTVPCSRSVQQQHSATSSM
jgi:hypothetical protein